MRRFAVCALASALALTPAAAHAADRAAQQAADAIDGSYIVLFDGSASGVDAETDQREKREGFKAKHRYKSAVKGFSAKLNDRQVEKLRADADVASVTADRAVHARGEAPTGVARMGAFDGGTPNGPAGVGVAVLDSGVDLDHPDLVLGAGTNCVTPGAAPDDDNGHGTHVAGSIAARANGAGVLGVAPDSTITPVKVLDANGDGSWASIICGIDYVTANAATIKVANMSLGGLGTSADNAACGSSTTTLHNAICRSTAAGVRYVVAAGNDAWPFPHSTAPDVPASYDEVVTVTAMGDSDGFTGARGPVPSCRTGEADDRYAAFSNWSDNATDTAHTIAGPGVCITSTYPGGGYHVESGTSMASPHVAGALALCVTSGTCTAADTPATLVQKLDSDDPAAGFSGDAFRPLSSTRQYGKLAVAGVPSAAPAAPLSLSTSTTSRSVKRGQSTTYGFTASKASTFSVSGLPAGTTASFSPTSGTSTTLTVRTSSATPRGTYTLTVRATSGAETASRNVSLTVR
jgi:subtilisin family serine protease